jgi:hypothetical protein
MADLEKKLELSALEKQCYDDFVSKMDNGEIHYRKLSPQTAEELMALYMAGRTLEEVHRANPQFHLGQIVYAAKEGKWFEYRERHLQNFLTNASARALQSYGEAILFVSDVVTAYHKRFQGLAQKVIQTGHENDMEKLSKLNMNDYKIALTALRELTGQGNSGKGKLPEPPSMRPVGNPPPVVDDGEVSITQLASIKKVHEKK